jgi:hypothetical protein
VAKVKPKNLAEKFAQIKQILGVDLPPIAKQIMGANEFVSPVDRQLHNLTFGSSPETGHTHDTEEEARARKFLVEFMAENPTPQMTEVEARARKFLVEFMAENPTPQMTRKEIMANCQDQTSVSARGFESVWRQVATPAYRRRGPRPKR